MWEAEPDTTQGRLHGAGTQAEAWGQGCEWNLTWRGLSGGGVLVFKKQEQHVQRPRGSRRGRGAGLGSVFPLQLAGWGGRAEDAQCESGRPSIMATDRKSVSGSSLAYLFPLYPGARWGQGSEEGASGLQRKETDS